MNNSRKERREEHGRSQAALADAVEVSRQMINAIERKRADPSLKLTFKFAMYFDCRIEDLFAPDRDPS